MNSNFILILIQLFVMSCMAGVGGTGGGNNLKSKYQLVTVRACDGGESGTECRLVRFVDRPKSENLVPECFIYHGEGAKYPCPSNYSKANFIQDVIKTFVNQGYNTKIMVQNL